MDNLGLNKYLLDQYGKTPEGLPYFRLIWSTNVTEKRFSEFTDFIGDVPIRTVQEVREVLKYPFAQDRWILERIHPLDEKAREMGLMTDSNFSYEEIYIFQDRNGNYLPLSREMLDVAMYLFFKHYLDKTPKERLDQRLEIMAKKDMEKKQKTKETIGEGRSPLFFVLE